MRGFTDPVPIHTAAFPSNWELSAGRAASVVRAFAEAGVAPERLEAAGRAALDPLSSNATALGRARNRRVEVLLPRVATGAAAAEAEKASSRAPPVRTRLRPERPEMKGKLKFIIPIVLLLVLGGVYKFVLAKPAAGAKPKVEGEVYVLPKDFLINLTDGKFAKLGVGLVFDEGFAAAPAGGGRGRRRAAHRLRRAAPGGRRARHRHRRGDRCERRRPDQPQGPRGDQEARSSSA